MAFAWSLSVLFKRFPLIDYGSVLRLDQGKLMKGKSDIV